MRLPSSNHLDRVLSEFAGWKDVELRKGTNYGFPPNTDRRYRDHLFPIPRFDWPSDTVWLIIVEDRLDQRGLRAEYARQLDRTTNGRGPLLDLEARRAAAYLTIKGASNGNGKRKRKRQR